MPNGRSQEQNRGGLTLWKWLLSRYSLSLAHLAVTGILLSECASSYPMPSSQSTSGGKMRTGVLIHGCHLEAKGWRSIMWGDEEHQRIGRLPHGARLAWQERAVLVVIGSGASEKAGVSEARFALGYLTSNWEELGKFKRAFGEINLEKMRAAVEPALVAEVRSKNTRQELVEAGRLFRKERCDRVILVSSPTHLPRCLRDACSLWLEPHSSSLNDKEGDDEDDWRQRWRPVVLASPSDTSFVDFGPNDVAIVEPPHRPAGGFLETVALSSARMLDQSTQDAAKIAEDVEETAPPLHKLVASALKVGEEDRRQFHREFHSLLRRYVPEE
ncbi:unnamed protein product [Ascophyllum nodosum]